MPPKTILILYPPTSRVCGIASWISTLHDCLVSRGWSVKVGLTRGNRFHSPEKFKNCFPQIATCEIDGRTGTIYGRRAAIQRAIGQTNPRIVLVTLLDDAIRVIPDVKSRNLQTKFVLAIHGNDPNHLAATIETHSYIDLVVTVNRLSFELLRDLCKPIDKEPSIQYVPNTVPAPFTAVPTNKSLREGLRIGFVGRLDDNKGVNLLRGLVLQLQEQQLNFKLFIAGDGPGRDVVKKLAADFPDNVVYLGALSRNRLYDALYPCLDVIFGASISEGWPLALSEAMIHGVVPVINRYCGLTAEGVLRHGENALIFEDRKLGEAAGYIALLSADRDLLARLGQNAAIEIENKFSVELFTQSWDQVLTGVLSREQEVVDDAPSRSATSFSIDWIKEFIRRSIRLYVPHHSIRSEWPTLTSSSGALVSKVKSEIARRNTETSAH